MSFCPPKLRVPLDKSETGQVAWGLPVYLNIGCLGINPVIWLQSLVHGPLTRYTVLLEKKNMYLVVKKLKFQKKYQKKVNFDFFSQKIKY